MPDRFSRHRGFSVVSAIFLLVVMAALGVAVLRLSTTQAVTSAQDIQGSRAYHAARAGVEWGIYQVMNPTDLTYAQTPCPPVTVMTVDTFSVRVDCVRCPGDATLCPSAATVYNEVNTTREINVYQITATASSGGAVGSVSYVERQITVKVSRCITNETGVRTLCG